MDRDTAAVGIVGLSESGEKSSNGGGVNAREVAGNEKSMPDEVKASVAAWKTSKSRSSAPRSVCHESAVLRKPWSSSSKAREGA